MNRNGFWTASNRSAAVLSLGLLGDTLLYLVLPVSCTEFGITSVWVGVLLSANRFVRLAANHGIVLAAQRFGLGTIMLVGAIVAAGTTLSYGLLVGGVALLVARAAWGISFASLRLGSLGFATHGVSGEIGSTLGRSSSIGQLGPLFAITVGSWMAQTLGARDVFIFLGLVSVIGIPIAYGLRHGEQKERRTSWRAISMRPNRLDCTVCMMAMIVDGLCIVTLTATLLAEGLDRFDAIALGGILLGLRQVTLTVIPPAAGHLADCFGPDRALSGALVVVVMGLVMIATGASVAGFLIVCTGASAATTLFPGLAARQARSDRLIALSSVVTWRDLGAAVGSLITGSLLAVAEIQTLYVAAIALMVPAVWSLRKIMPIAESTRS